jgi:glycosyltransferase involved in cell wall biosynthesis
MALRPRRHRSRVQTLLFLTAGPYFWPHEAMVRRRFELLSEVFDGFILSYVSRDEWRRVEIGKFQLIGYRISAFAYGVFLTRQLIRTLFVLGRSLDLHFRYRRIDAIVTYDPFGTGVLGYIISRLIGARLVVEVNNDFGNKANWNVESWNAVAYLKSSWVRIVGRFIMNRADVVQAIYPGQLDGFRGLRRSTRIEYIHPCVATSLFEREAIPRSSRRILFIGHPFYLKGVDLLLRAFNDISAEFPDVMLRIVGYLPEKAEFRGLFERNERVEFVGPVMPDRVIGLLADCYVLVLPSRSEGMPRVLIEAMASGRPIIASNVGGIPHYIRHGETGILFEREDVDALKKALRDVLGDEEYATRLGQNGRRYVLDQLSDGRHVEAMRRVLHSM